MYVCVNNEKLLEKYKTIWTKIEDLKTIKLNGLPVYDDRYIKTKIRTYGDKVMIQNANLLQSFLLILYLYTKTNITCKDVCTIVVIKL